MHTDWRLSLRNNSKRPKTGIAGLHRGIVRLHCANVGLHQGDDALHYAIVGGHRGVVALHLGIAALH